MDRNELLKITEMAQASEFQVGIFDFLAQQIVARAAGRQPKSLVVEAVAGSGKTTTVVAAAKLTQSTALTPRPLRVLFLAFNKSIATELGERLPSGVEAKTLNALGHQIWSRYAREAHGSVELDAYKTHKIVRNLFDRNQVRDYGADVRFLVSMCKSLGIVPASMEGEGFVSANGLTDSDQDLTRICRHFNHNVPVETRPTVFNMVRRVLEAGLRDERLIDFDDQKYMSVTKRIDGSKLPAFKYDAVIIDEVQDVNAVDIALINLVLKRDGIVIGVGDSKQAIYGFRGADTKSIENFKAAFNADTLPLSITYRCGTKIVEHAQDIVPSIQAAPNAHEGGVYHVGKFGPGLFQADDLVICRNNAPLISFAYKLINARVPVFVKGRDIGKNLIGLIEKVAGTEKWTANPRTGRKMKVMAFDGVGVADLVARIDGWEDQQVQIIRQENPDDEASVQRINDMADSIRVFTEANHDGLVDSVVADIKSLFGTEEKGDENEKAKGRVVLSTIHKSKGLEADRVFILDAELFFPSFIFEDTWQYEQEKNLVYVARTRAKNALVYIQKDSLGDDPPEPQDDLAEAPVEEPEVDTPAPKKSGKPSSRMAALRAKAAPVEEPEVDSPVQGMSARDTEVMTGDPRFTEDDIPF